MLHLKGGGSVTGKQAVGWNFPPQSAVVSKRNPGHLVGLLLPRGVEGFQGGWATPLLRMHVVLGCQGED